MIILLKLLWKCLNSPRLYRIYQDGTIDMYYQPKAAEKWGDRIINMTNTILSVSLYTSPFICMYVYNRGFYVYDECKNIATYLGGISCFLAVAFLLRGYGRATNLTYVQFLRTLNAAPTLPDVQLTAIRRYDFEFTAWPVSFKMPKQYRWSWWQMNPYRTTANDNLPKYQQVIIQTLAFIAVHTFALRLIYPGSLKLIHYLFWTQLVQGRSALVQSFNGKRTKIQTADGNFLDTMFVDNRMSSQKGEILVICCEGNSGFYEVGIMMTPVRTGYSALGWNHPGFAESTGLPYPAQEHNAIDAVIQYAIQKLYFAPDKIVMFGWSIGGYSAAWAAANYPIRGLILDATFDDLLPLAESKMPSSWSLLVKEVVRSYVNLDIAKLAQKYSGPIQLVRRIDDEIICLRPGHYVTNRGNYLLLDIIKHRHPELLMKHFSLLTRYTNMLMHKRPTSELPEDDELVLKHVSKYSRDFKSTHCPQLPPELFTSMMKEVLKKTHSR